MGPWRRTKHMASVTWPRLLGKGEPVHGGYRDSGIREGRGKAGGCALFTRLTGWARLPVFWGQFGVTPGGGLAAGLGPSQLHPPPERGSRPPSRARAQHGDLVCRRRVWARQEEGFARPEASSDSPGPGFQGCEAGQGVTSCLVGIVLFHRQTPLSISALRVRARLSPSLCLSRWNTGFTESGLFTPCSLLVRGHLLSPTRWLKQSSPSQRGNCTSGRNEWLGNCRSATSWACISQLFGNVPYLLHKRRGRRDLYKVSVQRNKGYYCDCCSWRARLSQRGADFTVPSRALTPPAAWRGSPFPCHFCLRRVMSFQLDEDPDGRVIKATSLVQALEPPSSYVRLRASNPSPTRWETSARNKLWPFSGTRPHITARVPCM